MTENEKLLKEIAQYRHDMENKSKVGACMTYNEGLLYGVSVLLDRMERIENQITEMRQGMKKRA